MTADSQEKTVQLRCTVDLEVFSLRDQCRVLAELAMSDKMTFTQVEALEGLLSLTDQIRDIIVEQGLATET